MKPRWVKDDWILAVATFAAVGFIIGLAFAPTWLLWTVLGVWAVMFVFGAVLMTYAMSRPVNDTDRELDRLDQELDRIQSGGGFR